MEGTQHRLRAMRVAWHWLLRRLARSGPKIPLLLQGMPKQAMSHYYRQCKVSGTTPDHEAIARLQPFKVNMLAAFLAFPVLFFVTLIHGPCT